MDKYQRIKSMFKKFKINAVFLLILSYFFVFSSLSADTLDEILRLTYSSNKQLIFSRTNLASVEKSIALVDTSNETRPGCPGGLRQVSVVSLKYAAGTIICPNRHSKCCEFTNPFPVTVSNVPPENPGPLSGQIFFTAGGST